MFCILRAFAKYKELIAALDENYKFKAESSFNDDDDDDDNGCCWFVWKGKNKAKYAENNKKNKNKNTPKRI